MIAFTFDKYVAEHVPLMRWDLRGPAGLVRFETADAFGVKTASVYLHGAVAPGGAELEDCEVCGKCWHDALLGPYARDLRASWEAADRNDEMIRAALERWYEENLVVWAADEPDEDSDVVVVPCRIHGRHRLDVQQAARVIVALYAQCEDLVVSGTELLTDTDLCAESMLMMALDVEGYAEYVDAEFEGIGISRCEHDVSRVLGTAPAATTALADEQAAHAKTIDNFESYAESTGEELAALRAALAAVEPVREDLGALFATLVPDLPIAYAAILAARLHERGYQLVRATNPKEVPDVRS